MLKKTILDQILKQFNYCII